MRFFRRALAGMRPGWLLAALVVLPGCSGLLSAPENPVEIRGTIEANTYRPPNRSFACAVPALDPVQHRIYDRIGAFTGRVVFLDAGQFIRIDYHRIKGGMRERLVADPEGFYRSYVHKVLWPMVKRAAPDAEAIVRRFARLAGRDSEFVVIKLPSVANKLDAKGLPYDAYRAMYVHGAGDYVYVVSMIDFDNPYMTWTIDPEALDIPNKLREVYLGCEFGGGENA